MYVTLRREYEIINISKEFFFRMAHILTVIKKENLLEIARNLLTKDGKGAV